MNRRRAFTELSLLSGSWATAFAVLACMVFGVFVLPYLVLLGGPQTLHPSELADPNGYFVEVAGESIYVTHTPGFGASDGDIVLLIHGFGGSTVTWRDTAPALADAGYDVYAVDLLGFGLSEKGWDHDYSHAAQAARVNGLMDALGIARAVVVGHSLGGDVAARIALGSPERVERLVLVSAAILADQGGGSELFAVPAELLQVPVVRRWGRVLMRRYVPFAFDGLLFDASYRDAMITTAVVEGYRRTLNTPDWDLGLMGILRDSASDAPPPPVEDVTVPTLIVWGAQDTWVPARHGTTLQDLIPGAERIEFADVGHLPMHEVPGDFNAALIAFLSGD